MADIRNIINIDLGWEIEKEKMQQAWNRQVFLSEPYNILIPLIIFPLQGVPWEHCQERFFPNLFQLQDFLANGIMIKQLVFFFSLACFLNKLWTSSCGFTIHSFTYSFIFMQQSQQTNAEKSEMHKQYNLFSNDHTERNGHCSYSVLNNILSMSNIYFEC